MYFSFVAPNRNEVKRTPRSSEFCSCNWPRLSLSNRASAGASANRSLNVRLVSGTPACVSGATKIAVQSIGIDESSTLASSVLGMPSNPELAIGEFGIGLFGIGEFGIGAAPTAEFGIGLFGIGAPANRPSVVAGTDESGTFAAPAGTEASSAVSESPARAPSAGTQAENS